MATTQPAKTSTSKAKTQPTPVPKQPAPTTFGGPTKKPMSLAAGSVPAAPPKRPAATTARSSISPSKDVKPKVSGPQSSVQGRCPLRVSDRQAAVAPRRWNQAGGTGDRPGRGGLTLCLGARGAAEQPEGPLHFLPSPAAVGGDTASPLVSPPSSRLS